MSGVGGPLPVASAGAYIALTAVERVALRDAVVSAVALLRLAHRRSPALTVMERAQLDDCLARLGMPDVSGAAGSDGQTEAV